MNILKKAFTTSRDGFMPSVFSQLDSKMSRPLSCRQELEDLILRNQQLADRIRIIPHQGYHHDQATFKKYFCKWIVAMVVGWVTPEVVNQVMLILVGKGGIYKSTFFNYLLPPQLRDYYLNESAAIYTDKDFMEAFSCKILMCLDEFDTAFGKSLNAFKSNMTQRHFSIRTPYDRFRSDLDHRATVAGTTNNQQITTAPETRR